MQVSIYTINGHIFKPLTWLVSCRPVHVQPLRARCGWIVISGQDERYYTQVNQRTTTIKRMRYASWSMIRLKECRVLLEAMFMREGEKVQGLRGYARVCHRSCQIAWIVVGRDHPSRARFGEASQVTTRQQLQQYALIYIHSSPLNTLAPAETHTQNERRRPQSSIRRHPRPRARHPPPGLRRHLWRRPSGREAAGCQRREEGC